MTGHTRLYRRGATYYHRAAIPVDIHDSYGKSEETFSLKTKDYQEALKLVRQAAVEVDAKFEAHRQYLKRMCEPKIDVLTTDQVRAMGERYYIHLLEEDQDLREEDGFYHPDERLPEAPIPSFEEYVEANAELEDYARQLMATARVDTFFHSEAREVLGWTDVSIPLAEDSKSWRVLALELVKQTVLARETIARRNKGVVIETPEISFVSGGSPKLLNAVEVWFSEKALDKDGWREKTAQANKKALEALVGCCGDKSLTDYGLKDATAYKQMLMALPANWVKHKDLKKLSIKDAAARASALDLQPQSVTNINKNLGFVRAFWHWAGGNYEGIQRDLFDGILLPRKNKRKQDRDPFSDEQLQRIFNSPIYTGCKSEREWKKAGSFSMKSTAKFWVPLLALYSGARLGELLQLRVTDIRNDNEVWYIDINEDQPDKKVKTREARQVPIHTTLENLGFFEYVKQRSRLKADMLFTDIEIGQDGYYSSPFSKHFNRFLSHAGAKTDKTAFHSFRHNFTDAGRNCGADMSVIASIQGHQGHGTQDTYGAGHNLEIVKREIDKLSYTGLNLEHLKRP